MADPRIDPNDPALQPLAINTEPLKGKKALITGIANQNSIAYGAARALKAFGAEIAMTYLNDKTREFTQQLADVLAVDPDIYLPHDINNDDQTEAVFAAIRKKWGLTKGLTKGRPFFINFTLTYNHFRGQSPRRAALIC
jgi:enoyl-[acyl-carrier protein] reductase I